MALELPILPGNSSETAITSAEKINNSHSLLETRVTMLESATGLTYADLKVNLTHAEALSLIGNSALLPNILYEITDFGTKHLVPNSTHINTGAVEALTLEAMTATKFKRQVFSGNYPNDYIEYDINDVSCEDGTWNQSLQRYTGGTTRKGFITRRIDTVHNLDFAYDFRNVKVRMYALNANIHSSVTAYNVGNWAYTGTTGSRLLYVCIKANTGASIADTRYWVQVLSEAQVGWHFPSSQTAQSKFGSAFLPINTSDYIDVFTLHNPDEPLNSSGRMVTGTYAGYGISNVKFEKSNKDMLSLIYPHKNYGLPNIVINCKKTGMASALKFSNIRIGELSCNSLLGAYDVGFSDVNVNSILGSHLNYAKNVSCEKIEFTGIQNFSDSKITNISNVNCFNTQKTHAISISDSYYYDLQASAYPIDERMSAIYSLASETYKPIDTIIFVLTNSNHVVVSINPNDIQKPVTFIKSVSSNQMRLVPTSGLINGTTSLTVTAARAAVTIYSDGNNLFII